MKASDNFSDCQKISQKFLKPSAGWKNPLLDYDTEKLASRREQNFQAPEDKSIKDW